MKYTFRLWAFVALLILFLPASAQRRNSRYNDYIKQYSELAIDQMNRYKIPASITLAQGLLESGAGQSVLARKSNNHFGIKCHNTWRGRKVYHDDDARGRGLVRRSLEIPEAGCPLCFPLQTEDYRLQGLGKGVEESGICH